MDEKDEAVPPPTPLQPYNKCFLLLLNYINELDLTKNVSNYFFFSTIHNTTCYQTTIDGNFVTMMIITCNN